MTYLDTSVLVPALADAHPNHAACIALISDSDAFTSSHALAESFSVLTKVYKYRSEDVSTVLIDLASALRIEAISIQDYLETFQRAKTAGVVGGLIYDMLHAAVARRFNATKVLTFNIGDFTLVAPDLHVSAP